MAEHRIQRLRDLRCAICVKVFANLDSTPAAFSARREVGYMIIRTVCGTCITRVLQGTPDHRDLYFTDEEHARNDQFTPCCSRSKSALLVLDI